MAARLPSEAALVEAWARRAYGAGALIDDGGRRVRVVFPGRRWGGPGPDFRGAVLALSDGSLERGDVEVHRRASGWSAHRHPADPAYDGVVLHVVARADAPTVDRHGRRIPTVVLDLGWPGPVGARGATRAAGWPADGLARDRGQRLSAEQTPGWVAEGSEGAARAHAWAAEDAWQVLGSGPCVRTAAAVRQVVAAAGRARFRARVARLEGDLAVVDADQVVWRAVAEGLGFTHNTAPFGRLADAVPWSAAAEALEWRGPLGLAGLLLGTAGLLAEASLAEAHAFRAFERRRNARQMLPTTAWERRQQRAANTPAQRCRGLAELAGRWNERTRQFLAPGAPRLRGPASHVLAAVREAANSKRPRPVWRAAYAPPWIGRGRAQVLVVNVLVPFATAAGCPEAAELFERLPGEPSNRVLRYMARLLTADQAPLRGALLQQGLLHLFSATCATRRCGRCPARGAAWPWRDAEA